MWWEPYAPSRIGATPHADRVETAQSPSMSLASSPRLRTAAAASAYAALAVADTRLATRTSAGARGLRLLTKPLLMPTLALAYAEATRPAPTELAPRAGARRLRTGTLTAQALSGLGDVALLGSGQRSFLTGLGSFFAAHVSYVAAYSGVARPWTDRSHRAGVVAAAGVFATAGPALALAAGRRDPALRGPVLAYAGVLSSMVAASTRLSPAVPMGARATLAAGTASFLVSDATIGLRNFVWRDPSSRSDGFVMGSYTLGQGLIALGSAAAVRARR